MIDKRLRELDNISNIDTLDTHQLYTMALSYRIKCSKADNMYETQWVLSNKEGNYCVKTFFLTTTEIDSIDFSSMILYSSQTGMIYTMPKEAYVNFSDYTKISVNDFNKIERNDGEFIDKQISDDLNILKNIYAKRYIKAYTRRCSGRIRQLLLMQKKEFSFVDIYNKAIKKIPKDTYEIKYCEDTLGITINLLKKLSPELTKIVEIDIPIKKKKAPSITLKVRVDEKSIIILKSISISETEILDINIYNDFIKLYNKVKDKEMSYDLSNIMKECGKKVFYKSGITPTCTTYNEIIKKTYDEKINEYHKKRLSIEYFNLLKSIA